MTELFKTLKLHVDKKARSFTADGFQNLYPNDTLKVIVTGLAGCDLTLLDIYLFEKEAGLTPDDALAHQTGAFAAVPGSADAAYATVVLDSDALADAIAAVAVGSELVCRLQILEDGMVVGDGDVALMPAPGSLPGTAPVSDPYLRVSDFAGLSDVAAMPVLNSAQLEAKLDAVIAYFRGLS